MFRKKNVLIYIWTKNNNNKLKIPKTYFITQNLFYSWQTNKMAADEMVNIFCNFKKWRSKWYNMRLDVGLDITIFFSKNNKARSLLFNKTLCWKTIMNNKHYYETKWMNALTSELLHLIHVIVQCTIIQYSS